MLLKQFCEQLTISPGASAVSPVHAATLCDGAVALMDSAVTLSALRRKVTGSRADREPCSGVPSLYYNQL